jgi:3-oxoacyl-[acyl-carrier protein] reductase
MSETIAPQGQVALVTGASRGIGRAIALALAAKGLRVIGTATTEAGATAIGAALAATGGRGIVLDVTSGDALGAAIDAVVKESGALHVLVNNAGITRDMLSMRMKDEDWDAVLATNLSAVFRACRAAIRPMMKQRYGRIVNITSVVGASGNAGQANYAAAKAGLVGLTRSVARELARRNITANVVAPGPIVTSMTNELKDDWRTQVEAAVPLGRFGTAEECAAVIAFLCSESAAYVTGAVVPVDGGLAMGH